MPTADDAFNEITESLAENMVVAFSQHKETGALVFDLMDVEDGDVAIAMAVKGLFLLVMNVCGWDEGEEVIEIDDSIEDEDEE